MKDLEYAFDHRKAGFHKMKKNVANILDNKGHDFIFVILSQENYINKNIWHTIILRFGKEDSDTLGYQPINICKYGIWMLKWIVN